MFSQTAEYALRASVTLAEHSERAVSATELAKVTSVPSDYLFKVMKQLVKAGLVVAVRGKYGGYRLSKSPSQISVLDVVNAVDPITRIHRCPLNRPEHSEKLCPLHQQLDDTYAQLERQLAQCSLAKLTEDAATSPSSENIVSSTAISSMALCQPNSKENS